MKKLMAFVFGIFAYIGTPVLGSTHETGWLNVVQVGGQVTSMFIVLSETVGEASCRNAWVVVSQGTLDADSQKRFYAALLVAMNTGMKIRLAVLGCYDSYHPTMIATDYWFLQNG